MPTTNIAVWTAAVCEGAESAAEEEVEGSRLAHAAEAETFMPPTPSGRIKMPHPTTRSWKGKEVEKMCWE